jgi:hypothetical protein
MLIYFAVVCIYMNLLPVNSVSEPGSDRSDRERLGSTWSGQRDQQNEIRQKIWHQMPGDWPGDWPGDGRSAPGDPGDAKINDRELKTLS